MENCVVVVVRHGSVMMLGCAWKRRTRVPTGRVKPHCLAMPCVTLPNNILMSGISTGVLYLGLSS